MDDPFYIGYQERSPEPHRRMVRRFVPVTGILLVICLALLVQAQAFDESRFEFGNTSEVQGRFGTHPVPHLRMADGSVVTLVGSGKAGAQVDALPGSNVQASGFRIVRGAHVMLELGSEATQVSETIDPMPVPVQGGPVRMVGEIVGAKCFLGVMNPAHGTVHRACARHCILGGVPAMFQPEPLGGAEREPVFLTGLEREEAVRLAARRIELRGTTWRLPGLEWIEVDDAQLYRPDT
ncbi:MAG: hypothetical protein JJ896_12670 [Rhodothermales bacterium]|nr:hypothetical protein [Rhodothermales bacterium]MBO6780500.1 hypothetical protein [Rhodothermales bacterium]